MEGGKEKDASVRLLGKLYAFVLLLIFFTLLYYSFLSFVRLFFSVSLSLSFATLTAHIYVLYIYRTYIRLHFFFFILITNDEAIKPNECNVHQRLTSS